jgi:hypothetical protein
LPSAPPDVRSRFLPEHPEPKRVECEKVLVGKDAVDKTDWETTMASIPTGGERPREATAGDLLEFLLADIRLMLQREAELAKREVKDKGSRLGVAGGILAGAAVVALLGLATLVAAAVLGLAIQLPAWAAALVVGVVLIVVAVVLYLVGRARMRSVGSLAPTATLETAREDVAWIRRETERLRSTE